MIVLKWNVIVRFCSAYSHILSNRLFQHTFLFWFYSCRKNNRVYRQRIAETFFDRTLSIFLCHRNSTV